MEYRKFGSLDFEVSVIGFGAAAISGEGGGYGFGAISEAASIELVHAAQDAGINLFDTAPIYGFRMSEIRLGLALKGHRRDSAFVVSKCGVSFDDKKRVRLDNSPETTQRMLEQSLRDLQTGCIDLYMVHWPDENVDIRATMEVLVRAQEQGKIGAIGLSNTSPTELDKAQEIGAVAVCQSQLSLFEPAHFGGLQDRLSADGMGFMSWGTLEKGILTGRVTAERRFDQHDARSKAPWWKKADHSKHYETMARITPLLDAAGHTGLELALSHNLGFSEVSTALCGARNRGQLDSLLAASDNLVSDELLSECRRVTADVFGH